LSKSTVTGNTILDFFVARVSENSAGGPALLFFIDVSRLHPDVTLEAEAGRTKAVSGSETKSSLVLAVTANLCR
jgi:hypothetical protein